jgi:hypothetical protein
MVDVTAHVRGIMRRTYRTWLIDSYRRRMFWERQREWDLSMGYAAKPGDIIDRAMAHISQCINNWERKYLSCL